jgi:polar amino acid transport system substrate-binding protein
MAGLVLHLGRCANLAALLVMSATPAVAEAITIHTEAWEDYTNKDGTGFAWDTIRAVYNPVGIELNIKIVPYARAVDNVTHRDADAWVASYRNENKRAVYPDWHYDADRVAALYVRDRTPAPATTSDLKNKRVAWVRGYKMEQYIDVPMKAIELNKQETSIRMLKHGRIDFFLDARYVIKNMLENLPDNLEREEFAFQHVTNLPLYLAFAPTSKGRRLAEIWDERFPQLLKNGTIAELYDKYDYTHWPFDQSRSDSGS